MALLTHGMDQTASGIDRLAITAYTTRARLGWFRVVCKQPIHQLKRAFCVRDKGDMGMTIKPIETKYNGYRFRSRLEARWAVFLDEIGVAYDYEPEGFDIDGVWYLPDFLLTELDVWFEVKGQEPGDEEWEKIIALSRHYLVIVAVGQCGMEATHFYLCGNGQKIKAGLWLCPDCKHLAMRYSNEDDTGTIARCILNSHINHFPNNTPTPDVLIAGYFMAIAFTKARQAQFEHGKTPRGKRNRRKAD